ncbi:fatty acid desaturase family protein [Chryseolinea lacunae]|uniref:Acyl-CoA desaturase n=1 Tax=Chryseolinea lacunae TaxID=2801331 RepID=A0ABS1L035_9BACT|nr:acyl-CoA desaturase [Chryseolinea lacunae]MBL0744793.1 acyl-CoA desaturase [Chryseolinea lacunae]
MLKYTFDTDGSFFFRTLKQKVDRYFTESRLHPAGNRKLYFKSILQIVSASALYTVLVFFTPMAPVSIFLCLLLGLNLAVIGFNVMHEGGHQSFSRIPWMNNASAYFLNILGGITYYWKIKHNVNHHTYTNIEGMDSDIDVKPFMRLHADQPRHGYHRFQHVYFVVLYGVSYLAWIFYEDFQKYFSGKISTNSERKKLALKERGIFWFTKIMYVVAYVVVPIVMVGWLWWLIGFFIITFVCGLAISLVFQLAHVVEGTSFHSALHQDDAKKQEWAIHQITSTANFATSSKSLYWLLGGLNFQIEHHLFPRVSHIHYPAISRLVKEACRESNVLYNEYSSMYKAVVSHLIHLRKLGSA